MTATEKLFVYGTLRPELAPPAQQLLLAEARRLGPGWLPGLLYDLGPYPAAVPDPAATSRIVGEVLELPESVLPLLDAYEECDLNSPKNSLFVRRKHDVTLADGRVFPCWVYVYNRNPTAAAVIPDGDYLSHRAARGRV
jgi:gamma-glutamylcyclotransferase (GGCT)/AIG2-like uncharacterized protein YtfP